MDPIRIVAAFLIWMIFPVQVVTLMLVRRQMRKWAESEEARMLRWARDMDDAGALRNEAQHLRKQAEIFMAQSQNHLAAWQAKR